MVFPALTARYAAALAVVFAVLSAWVIAGRFGFGILHGDGGSAALNRRIRAQANFAEYVPIILILSTLLEASGASRLTMHALLLPLLIARMMHPIGMVAREGAIQQFAFRGAPAAATVTILIAAAVLLLVRA